MQVAVETKALAEATQAARLATDRESLQGLHRLLLEADAAAGQLRVTGTNMEVWVAAQVPATVRQHGTVAVDARALAGLAAQLPDSMTELEVQGSSLVIRCGSARVELQTADPGDFPAPPDVGEAPEVRVSASSLLEACRMVKPCMMDSDRYLTVFTGMLFEAWAGTLAVTATDRSRLAHREVQVEGGPEEAVARVLPRDGVQTLMALLRAADGPVTLRLGERLVSAAHERWQLVSRVVEGSFPPYASFFIDAPATRAIVQRDAFEKAVRRLVVLERGAPQLVRLAVEEGAVRLSVTAADIGRGEDVVPARTEGPPVQATYQARFLVDLCDVLGSEELVYEVGDPRRQAQFRRSPDDRSFWHVAMPFRAADAGAQEARAA